MEVTMILNHKVLTSLSTDKGIMELETIFSAWLPTLPLPFYLWEDDESFHLWIIQHKLFMEQFYKLY